MESIHLFLLLFLQNVLLIVSHPPAANVWTFCHLFSLVPNPQGQVQPTPSFGAAGRNALPIPSRSSGREISSPNTDKALTELNKKQLHPPPAAFQGLVSDLTEGFSAPRSLRVYRPPWEAGPKIRGGVKEMWPAMVTCKFGWLMCWGRKLRREALNAGTLHDPSTPSESSGNKYIHKSHI